MTKYLHTNNASSNLRTGINAVATTLQVAVGQGVLFPNPVVGEGFFVTVEDRRIGRLEIMLCTSRSTDTLTVVRGQQGTIPQSFGAGVNVANRLTAQILNDFVTFYGDVIPLAQIPQIPDSKIIDLSATKLTGTINSARLPVIPSTLLTSVPAASLTGTIAAARLPNPLPAANLPPIPSTLLTSVPAGNLTGTIPTSVLPNIPSTKLTVVPAANLSGVVPNANISGNYDGLNTITGVVAAMNEFRGDVGAQNDPTYTFTAAQDAGMYYNTTWGPSLVFGNVIGFSVNNDAARVWGTTVFSGDGSKITNLNAVELNGNVPQSNLANAFHAAGSAPLYAVRAWVKWTLPATILANGNVASVADLGGGQFRITFTVPMNNSQYSVSFNHSSVGDGNIIVAYNAAYCTVQTSAPNGTVCSVQVVQ